MGNQVRSRRKAPGVLADVVEFVQDLARSLFDPYRPELHYMRGPGPKWREKYGAKIDGASPAVTRALMAGLRP